MFSQWQYEGAGCRTSSSWCVAAPAGPAVGSTWQPTSPDPESRLPTPSQHWKHGKYVEFKGYMIEKKFSKTN